MEPVVVAGKYRVVRAIGKGGMGAVYEAVHDGTGKHVALKIMALRPGYTDDDNKAALARFEREARVAGNIETQHIAHIFDTGEDVATGMPFMVMELLKGHDLSKTLRKLGRLRADLALRIVAQAGVGLSRAHAAGIVHRDVKPSNLFLAEGEFGDLIVKVLDFGIAKGLENKLESDHTLTRTGTLVGSPHYMSPEQAKGDKTLDYRTDIWSLGIVLYKCLAGATPYDHLENLGEVIVAICSEETPSIQSVAPWVSPEISAVLRRALQRRRDDRYQSVAEMIDAIKPLIAGDASRLTPDMLSPMTEAESGFVAARKSEAPTALDSGSMSAPRFLPSTPSASGTIGAVASARIESLPAPTRSSRRVGVWLAVAAVPVLAAVAWGTGLGPRLVSTLAGVGGTEARAGSAAVAPPRMAAGSSAPSSTASSGPAVSTDKVVMLSVTPPGAAVEIDGLAADVQEGRVALTGAPGSVHKVRVSIGKLETVADVVITEKGPLPGSLALAPAAEPARAAAPPAQAPPSAKRGIAAKPNAGPAAPRPQPSKGAGFDQTFE